MWRQAKLRFCLGIAWLDKAVFQKLCHVRAHHTPLAYIGLIHVIEIMRHHHGIYEPAYEEQTSVRFYIDVTLSQFVAIMFSWKKSCEINDFATMLFHGLCFVCFFYTLLFLRRLFNWKEKWLDLWWVRSSCYATDYSCFERACVTSHNRQ